MNKNILLLKKLQKVHYEKFNSGLNKNNSKNTTFVLSPGRVNIIGEHTDYNHGLSLTIAIDKYKYLFGVKNNTNIVNIYDNGFKQHYSFELEKIEYDKKVIWANYIKGIVNEYIKNNHKISGFDLIIDSNLLSESGVSSSAAILAGVSRIINKLFHLKIILEEEIKYCWNAENNFIGVNNGALDHFSVLYGKERNAVLIDFKDLSYKYIPFNLKDCIFLIIDSKETRNLINTDYNKRRQECRNALRILKEYIDIESLSDVDLETIQKLEHRIDTKLLKRVKHIVTENIRVRKAIECLKYNDLEKLGRLLSESHVSLRDNYRVSTEKLDFIFNAVNSLSGVYGIRLMGAGFGGSLISLVNKNMIDQIIEDLSDIYYKKYKIFPGFIKCKTSNGTEVVDI